MIKYFILRTDFKPGFGRSQPVSVLLNSKNELPMADSSEEAKNILGQDLEIGNIFYDNGSIQCVFANLPEKAIEALSNNWKLISFDSLRPENCSDYDIVLDGIKKAGYSIV